MKKGKHIAFSIKAKLLLFAILPAVVLSVTLTYLAASNIRTGMQEETLHGLRGMALSLRQIYETADTGDYTVDESGNVLKGEQPVSGQYEIVDTLKDSTQYDVTIFYGDTRVTTSLRDHKTNERLIGTKASDKVIQTVLKEGKEYSDTSIVINGDRYYGYYVPILQNGTPIGMAFSGLPCEDADAFIQKKVTVIIIVSFVVLISILIAALFFCLKLGTALTDIQKVVSAVGNGNLTVGLNENTKKRKDEIGFIASAVEQLISELVSVIGNVKQSSKVLFTSGTTLEEMASQSSQSTNEISHAVEDISRGAMNQADETEAASSNIAHMGDVITEIVTSVDKLSQASQNMKKASDDSTIIIKELSDSNDKTTEAIDKISLQVHTTNQSVQEIRQAVELITSIATETNLLSLNASIEAARAGEHGRGFAVVASQIQKLAEESNNSAQEITNIIDTLLKDSEQTVQVMDEVNVIVSNQREKLNETKEKFLLVTEGVDATRQETEIIEGQTATCNTQRAKILDIIQNLSAISEENAASTQETTASMEELNATLNLLAEAAKDLLELSSQLEESMNFFHV